MFRKSAQSGNRNLRKEETFGFALPALLAHFKRIYLSVFRFLFVNYGKVCKEKIACGIWSFSIWQSHKYRANLFEVFSSFILTSPFTFMSFICSQDQAQSISYFNFFSGLSAQISSTCYLISGVVVLQMFKSTWGKLETRARRCQKAPYFVAMAIEWW